MEEKVPFADAVRFGQCLAYDYQKIDSIEKVTVQASEK